MRNTGHTSHFASFMTASIHGGDSSRGKCSKLLANKPATIVFSSVQIIAKTLLETLGFEPETTS